MRKIAEIRGREKTCKTEGVWESESSIWVVIWKGAVELFSQSERVCILRCFVFVDKWEMKLVLKVGFVWVWWASQCQRQHHIQTGPALELKTPTRREGFSFQ